MSNEREFQITYKGVTIDCIRGSQWVYINGRAFDGLHRAKIWVNNRMNYYALN